MLTATLLEIHNESGWSAADHKKQMRRNWRQHQKNCKSSVTDDVCAMIPAFPPMVMSYLLRHTVEPVVSFSSEHKSIWRSVNSGPTTVTECDCCGGGRHCCSNPLGDLPFHKLGLSQLASAKIMSLYLSIVQLIIGAYQHNLSSCFTIRIKQYFMQCTESVTWESNIFRLF